MAEKAKKSTKTKKPATKTTKKPAATTIKSTVTGKKKAWDKPCIGKIVCLCVLVIAIIVIIVATMTHGSVSIGDNFFVSDETKYVLNIPVEDEEDNDENLAVVHTLYYYADDTITGVKTYYEFKTAADAKTAYDSIKELMEADDSGYEYELSGKYVIATTPLEEFADLTVSEVKATIEFYEALQNDTLNNLDDEEENEEE